MVVHGIDIINENFGKTIFCERVIFLIHFVNSVNSVKKCFPVPLENPVILSKKSHGVLSGMRVVKVLVFVR